MQYTEYHIICDNELDTASGAPRITCGPGLEQGFRSLDPLVAPQPLAWLALKGLWGWDFLKPPVHLCPWVSKHGPAYHPHPKGLSHTRPDGSCTPKPWPQVEEVGGICMPAMPLRALGPDRVASEAP